MRIALVHPSLGLRRGVEKIVLWLGQEFSERGHSVSVFTSEYNAELHGSASNYLCDIRAIGGPGLGPSSLSETIRVGRALGHALQQFDIICAFGYPASTWIFFGKRGYKKFPPVVWYCNEPPRILYDQQFSTHVPGLLSRYAQNVETVNRHAWGKEVKRYPSLLLPKGLRAFFQRAVDRLQVTGLCLILANSTFTMERLRTIYNYSNVKVCHLGVPLPSHNEMDLCDDKGYILTVSHLHPIKNLEVALRAVQLLRKQGQLAYIPYRIIGKGPDLPRLQHLAAAYGVLDLVSFEGFASEAALAQAYAGAKLLLYIPFDEPFGLPPLEAAVYAKTSVVSNHGGMVDTVLGGISGIHVDPFNPKQVADAIGTLIANTDLRKQMGQAARKRVEETFTLPAFADRLEYALCDVLAS